MTIFSVPSQQIRRSSRLSIGDISLLESLTASGTRDRPPSTGRFLTMHKRRRKKLTTRSLSQDNPAILDDVMHGQVQCILDQCGLWAFNAFALETAAGGRSLPVLCVHLFHWYGLLDYFNLDVVRVWKLFTLIEEGYHSSNPYHNSIHATDVTQAMHCFLQEEKIKKHMSPVEVMASLIGAVAHDLDHPGVNQPFLIATSNHLATLYDNMSVLENHHWRSAVGCLLESGVAEQLTPWRDALENQIRSLILATDITRQQEFLSKLKKGLDTDALDMSREEDRHFILQIALKCADISNPTRPWDVSRKWSLKVCEEFFRQGDFERKLNLPITSLCDRYSTSVPKIQTGFIRFVVTPLFSEWHRFLSSELSTYMMQLLASNQKRWESLENAENAEETRTELSDTEPEQEIEFVSERGSSEKLLPPDYMQKKDILSKAKSNRRHSVPVSVGRSLFARADVRRESLPPGIHKSQMDIPKRTSSRVSSDPSDALYNSALSLISGGSGNGRKNSSSLSTAEKDERPISAEELLPEPSIASMTAVGLTPGSRTLTRQQTFPPLQPYVRVRYLSTTAEMATCREALLEGGSHSNSSHSSQENMYCTTNQWNQPIPTVAILSPNNGRGPEMFIPELQVKPSTAQAQSGTKRSDSADWDDKENTPKIPKISDSSIRGQKENLDPRRSLANDLAKRRGSAPVTSHIKSEDINQPSIALRADILFSRRGSVPAENLRQKTFDIGDTENRLEPVVNKIPTSISEPLHCQYPRRGSVPAEIPLVRTDILTRHSVSLNGKAGRRKKQLRRRSSGGPETVCLIPDVSDGAAWHRLRREIVRRSSDFNPDAALARRRGSLPIEVLTIGHSGSVIQ
ncbi:calcium/calmodulin-dependent 3',5'-cyclic nucleotide phosphodiesterase 1C-like isoform X3 [Chrysoperla carnea]|uniref:calcium/calmodulin-dependent 3',5'-cyclic nucleotide phosphodiesterase 1C-like isoform X3 n=1 Tax=Chrysoperla carnea TaxID=189513 RepID=UPI001D07CF3D|nr:calcium/calmodulin-dependent 3',5'-cyclic nucleotide phosphodiesterase 1C-like isoform X3 [Chrysoperla carnea]